MNKSLSLSSSIGLSLLSSFLSMGYIFQEKIEQKKPMTNTRSTPVFSSQEEMEKRMIHEWFPPQ